MRRLPWEWSKFSLFLTFRVITLIRGKFTTSLVHYLSKETQEQHMLQRLQIHIKGGRAEYFLAIYAFLWPCES